MTKAQTIATLKELATKYKSRSGFNRAVGKMFGEIGEGAFRRVHTDGAYAIKIRLTPTEASNCVEPEELDSANEDEMVSYIQIAKHAPDVAYFVLKPTYISLPNDHDAVLMKRVDAEPTECIDTIVDSHPMMRKQYDFILDTFNDAGDTNIGWDTRSKRMWYLDLNYELHNGVLICCENKYVKKAKKLRKQITGTTK